MVKKIYFADKVETGSLFKWLECFLRSLLVLLFAVLPTVCFSTEYRVSTQAEFDAIKNAVLQPGDAILLARGQQFVGMLAPTGKGTAADPIRIGAYGEGDRPLIDAQGEYQAGVLLAGDIAFWEVAGLEITNNNGTNNEDDNFFGVLVVISGPDNTVYEHIYIHDNYIHDVNGAVAGKDRGGIHVYITGLRSSIVDDLRITNNRIEYVGGVGIATKSSCGNVTVHAVGYTAEYLWTDVYIGSNYVSRTGRNSIIIRISQDPIVEYNVVAYSSRYDTGNSIFCFDTVGCIMQYNEAYGNTGSGADRGGFDADYTCVDTYIQYNYSHDNEWFCSIMKKAQRNVVIRYNVSQNEKQGFYFYGFDSDTECEDVHIYNNTHYVRAGNSATVIVQGRKPLNTTFENNIFYFEDPDDAGYGSNVDKGINTTFKNNLYYNLTPHASDPTPIVGDPLLTFPGVSGTDIDLRTMGGLRGYQLLPGSPALDVASVILGAANMDVVGTPINDGSPDIGAFEYVGPLSRVTFEFAEGSVWDAGAGGGQIGAHASLMDSLTGERITLRTVDVIGQDGSLASNGAEHRTNIAGASYLGIDDKSGAGEYSQEFRNFNPNEGWVFAFDKDVYLETIRLGSQSSDAELTLSSELFDAIILADGPFGDIHDLESRMVPAGTELTLMMTTPTDGVDTGIGVTSITVSAVPFLTQPTVLQAESYDDAIGVVHYLSSDDAGGEAVAFDAIGDEISYAVNVSQAGTYLVGFRVASTAGAIHLDILQNGNWVAGLQRMITDDGTWTTIYKEITLESGISTLRVVAAGGDFWLNWLEFKESLLVSYDLENSALNQAYRASNIYQNNPVYAADKAFDGDFTTRWATDTSPASLEVDFGESVLVYGTRFYDYGNRIRSYEIQVFDGEWKTAFVGGASAPEQTDLFPFVSGSKIRLQVLASAGNPSIWEFEVFSEKFESSIEIEDDVISLEWKNIPGLSYSVQSSTDLVTDPFVRTIESGIPALTDSNRITIEKSAAPAAFYRIIAE